GAKVLVILSSLLKARKKLWLVRTSPGLIFKLGMAVRASCISGSQAGPASSEGRSLFGATSKNPPAAISSLAFMITSLLASSFSAESIVSEKSRKRYSERGPRVTNRSEERRVGRSGRRGTGRRAETRK